MPGENAVSGELAGRELVDAVTVAEADVPAAIGGRQKMIERAARSLLNVQEDHGRLIVGRHGVRYLLWIRAQLRELIRIHQSPQYIREIAPLREQRRVFPQA